MTVLSGKGRGGQKRKKRKREENKRINGLVSPPPIESIPFAFTYDFPRRASIDNVKEWCPFLSLSDTAYRQFQLLPISKAYPVSF
jgi:hypothetical protein